MSRMCSGLLACTIALGCVFADDLELAVRGQLGNREIVVAPDASECVRYAADELRDHLAKATGVTLPVVARPAGKLRIFVGPGAGPESAALSVDLGSDGFRLVVRGRDLYVCGSGERGALYGVYELLERFGGCGWYSPKRTVVPRRNVFSVPENLDLREKPAFAMRESFWADALLDPAFAARLRCNMRSEAVVPTEPKYGGCPFRFGGGLGIAHTHQVMIPVKDYYKDHPEYFCLYNGRRLDRQEQLCLTNPDVLRIVTEKVLVAIRSDPAAKIFGVSHNDYGWTACQCENCRRVNEEEGSNAGTEIRFVNAVAEAVEKEYPDKLIQTLAYQFTQKPPKTCARRNVIVCMCTEGGEFSTPIRTSRFSRGQNLAEDFRGWQKRCGRMYVWDYVTYYDSYLHPMVGEINFQDNMRFYRDCGAVGVFAQGCTQGRIADLNEFKCWMLAKLMWNPDADYAALVRRFTDGNYGKAAPYIREYLELRKTLVPLYAFNPRGLCPWHRNPVPLPDAFLDRADELFRKASEAVRDDPESAAAVRVAKLPVDYMLIRRADMAGPATREMGARAESFLEYCKANEMKKGEGIGHFQGLVCYSELGDQIRRDRATISRVAKRSWRLGIVDLSAQTNNQFVLESGWYGRNCTDPVTILEEDGSTMYATWTLNGKPLSGPVTKSVDAGKTWKKLANVPSPDLMARLAAAAKVPFWKPPKQLQGLIGDRYRLLTLKDGRRVVCFRDLDPDSPTMNHFVAWVGSVDALEGRSKDPGYRIKLLHSADFSDNCGFSSVHLLEDGTVVVTAHVKLSPYLPPSIVCTRFNPVRRVRAGAGTTVEEL